MPEISTLRCVRTACLAVPGGAQQTSGFAPVTAARAKVQAGFPWVRVAANHPANAVRKGSWLGRCGAGGLLRLAALRAGPCGPCGGESPANACAKGLGRPLPRRRAYCGWRRCGRAPAGRVAANRPANAPRKGPRPSRCRAGGPIAAGVLRLAALRAGPLRAAWRRITCRGCVGGA